MIHRLLALTALWVVLVAGCGSDDPASAGDGGAVNETPPAAVDDLRLESIDGSNIDVAWTVPGNDGNEGTAAIYHIRYSANLMSAAAWDTDLPLAGAPEPAASGNRQTTVIDVSCMSDLYVAMKTDDEAANLSDLSNVVHVSLTADFVVQQLTHNWSSKDPVLTKA